MYEEFSFGNWLKQRRKRLDLTQEQLARQVTCAVSTIQKLESDERKPSEDFAVRLAEVIGIEPAKWPAFIEMARGTRSLSKVEPFRPPTNLPAPYTPFIGRKAAVKHISKKLKDVDTRLITLTGPPGIGKTRLSLQVAGEVRDSFDHGVYFVPLVSVTDLGGVIPAITQTLQLRNSGRVTTEERLYHFLKFKKILLILDNFEQVVEAAPITAELLAACPLLKLLVTSRVPLRVRAERQYPVTPLSIPDLNRLPPLEELLGYSAIELFVDRSEAVNPIFEINEGNALAVASLCNRLDGIPLAIELIAARTKIMEPALLLSRLGGSIILHSDSLRDLEDHQHTLRITIERSYQLLNTEERSVFRWLGLFSGGCSLEAAEYLHGQFADPSVAPAIQILGSLVDSSLVNRVYVQEQSRFTMLDTIREYAVYLLRRSDDETELRNAHASYYLSIIEEASPRLHRSVNLINQIEVDYSNFHQALRWLMDSGDLETAYRLAVSMAALWSIHDWHLSEGRNWLERLLTDDGAGDLKLSALSDLHQQAGVLAYLQNDYAISRRHHRDALFYARKTNDPLLIGHALHGLSNTAMNQGKYEEVVLLIDECIPLARSTGDKWLEAMALNNLAEVRRLSGDLGQAEQLFEEGLALLEELGDKFFMAILLDGLGTLAQYKGKYDRASEIHLQCLEIATEMDDRRIVALTLEKLSGVAAGSEQAERAARLLGAAEALRESILSTVEAIDRSDYERFLTMTRNALSDTSLERYWAEGRAMNLDEAVSYAREAGASNLELGNESVRGPVDN